MKSPKIRFKGFDGDWEQRKLGEVFQEYSEKNHPELPALTIIQGGGTVLRDESDRNLQYDKSSLSGYKMVCEDDFIVHLRSFEGGLEKSNHNGLISPAYHTFHGDNMDSRFYYPYFRSYEFIKHKLVPHVYGIRDGRSIDIDGMKTIEIPWTSYGEQKKIGDYIESLDHLITLHQKKCEQLTILKKYMLQKMFPQNGSDKPEIRFDGFTDDWEQRKLGELCSEIGDGLHSAPIYDENGEYYFINGNNLVNGKIVIDTTETNRVSKETFMKNDKSLDDKTILLSINGTIGNLAYYGDEKVMLGKSAAYLKAQNIAKEFLYASLQTSIVMDSFMLSLTGTTIKNLGLEAIKNTKIYIPRIKEQQQIGTYFKNLDHLITLHQNKCNELKELKKFMLQNMFV